MQFSTSILATAALATPSWFTGVWNEHTEVGGLPSLAQVMRNRDLQKPYVAKCPLQFDLVHVQDRTGSFSELMSSMRDWVTTNVDNLTTAWPGSRYALTTFADKPVPYSGFGDYADAKKQYVRDVCYHAALPLIEQPVMADTLSVRSSGGGDYAENVFGAMLSALSDRNLGWEPTRGRVRILLTVTDAISHEEGDLLANINKWNAELGTEKMEREDAWLLAYGGCSVESAAWRRFRELRGKFDAGSLDDAEKGEFGALVEVCGPFFNPADIVPHPNTLPELDIDDCMTWEYPSTEKVVEQLKAAESTIPVVLSMGPNAGLDYVKSLVDCPDAGTEAECVRHYFEESLSGVSGAFMALEGGQHSMHGGIAHMLRMVQAAYDASPNCQDPPSTECPEFQGTEPCLDDGELLLRFHGGRKRFRANAKELIHELGLLTVPQA